MCHHHPAAPIFVLENVYATEKQHFAYCWRHQMDLGLLRFDIRQSLGCVQVFTEMAGEDYLERRHASRKFLVRVRVDAALPTITVNPLVLCPPH